MPIEQKQYSTDPEWTAYLNDSNGWIDVTSANSVKLFAKISGGASIGPFTMSVATIHTFTADATQGSNVLTSISNFTGIVAGTIASTLVESTFIPANTLVVAFDTTANTITMSNPASESGSGSVQADVGMATYQPTTTDVETTGVYGCEAAIHWDDSDTLITLVPNRAAANEAITIDPNLTGSLE